MTTITIQLPEETAEKMEACGPLNLGNIATKEIEKTIEYLEEIMIPFNERTTFHAMLEKEDDTHIATCIEIGTTSQGKTEEEALENLKEATELYLEEGGEVPKRKRFDIEREEK